jgi:hypothetical protein
MLLLLFMYSFKFVYLFVACTAKPLVTERHTFALYDNKYA